MSPEPVIFNPITKLQNYSIFLHSSLLAVKVHEQIVVLINAYPMQLGFRQLGREPLPDGYGQILCRGNARGKFRDFFVQETMVHRVEHLVVHDLFELFEINYEARPWIDLALYRDFEYVVVPVAIRVIAFAEQSPVLLRRELRVMVVMRRSKFSFAGEVEQRSVPFPSDTRLNCNWERPG
jgi:hypothetical protein